jgi:hypothetical protein
MVKKYSVCRFAPRPVRVLDKFPDGKRFFSPYCKKLVQNTYLLNFNIKNENFKILNPSPDG